MHSFSALANRDTRAVIASRPWFCMRACEHLRMRTNGDEAGAVSGVDLVQRSAVSVRECERRFCDQMQYRYPHVAGSVEHRLASAVSLPPVVKHCVPSMPFVGSYRRFIG
jgi:hypothetical protein